MNHSLSNANFAFIRRAEDSEILFVKGDIREETLIKNIALPPNELSKLNVPSMPGLRLSALALLPFSQVTERGFPAHNDGAPIVVLDIKEAATLTVDAFQALLPPREEITLNRAITFDRTSEEYEEILATVISKEIGNGEGANFVIPRAGKTKIANMSLAKALQIFNNLLISEKGTYWTYLFKFGASYLIGATPERHVTLERGIVRMNPISGTYRKNEAPKSQPEVEKHVTAFLSDEKEINELFMVVDEELKQMSRICSTGGTITGPYLKNMAKLVHTEYLLSGRSKMPALQVLYESMFAATVSGSPIESACRVIKKYEKAARRYYGSAIALLGETEDGSEYLDSPIPIRTIEIKKDGEVEFRVGGTLVRDSDPCQERLETDVKFAAVIGSLQASVTSAPQYPQIEASLRSDRIRQVLLSRNERLAKFWFLDQDGIDHSLPSLHGKNITVIENEDDFAYMLGHMLDAFGANVSVVKYPNYSYQTDTANLVVVGPGPGDPNDGSAKMKLNEEVLQRLLQDKRKFIAVCLGHQLLCRRLEIPIIRKSNPQQGVAKDISYFGKNARLGFYNTFAGNVAKYENDTVQVSASDQGEVFALRGEHFDSVQFHPESILSRDGFEVLKSICLRHFPAGL